MSYWDTSAIVKLFLEEPDSNDFRQKAAGSPFIATSSLTRFEGRAVFWRQEAIRAIDSGSASHLTEMLIAQLESRWLEVRMDLLELEEHFEHVLKVCWRQATPLRIRSLDAIHLATALMLGEPQFVSADNRQRDAATLLGFEVL